MATEALEVLQVLRSSSVRAASEAGANADDERDRPPRAVVVDRLEAGTNEGIYLRESRHVAKADLEVEVGSIGDWDENPAVHAKGERGGAIVEVGRVLHVQSQHFLEGAQHMTRQIGGTPAPL